MKKVVSLLLVLAIAATMLLALVSCGAPADDGAEIKVYLGTEMYDFDPTDYYEDSNAEQVMNLLFEPLFRYLENGKIQYAAAQHYTVDEEERKIVITLRESYWSDDTRVKAEDFVFAWKRLLDPNNPNPAAALLYDVVNAPEVKSGVGNVTTSDIGVYASSTYELTIEYREGADYMQILRNLSSIATAPIRASLVEPTPTYWSKFANTLCCNGPFEVGRYSTETDELNLIRNKGYHQNPDVVDYDNQVIPGALIGFVTSAGETVNASYADIENKVVFYMQEAPTADVKANAGKVTFKDQTSVYSYVFDTTNPLFAIPEVRQALSLVIDRAAIVDALGYGKAADGFVPDVSGGSSEALISANANIARANELLARVTLPANKSFTLTVADNEKSRIVAGLVETAWESLGFRVTVQYAAPVETTIPADTSDGDDVVILDDGIQVLLKKAAAGQCEFDVLGVDWQTYTNESFAALASLSSNMSGCNNGGTSVTGWSDTDYNYLITAAFKASGNERKALLAEAEEYLCEAAPIVPIIFNQTATFVSSELSGVRYDGFGNAIFTTVKQKNYQNYFEEDN